MAFWCVVQTETRRELTVARYLDRAGYLIKVPRLKVRRNGDWRIEPLFPSYIFARTDESNWSPIRWTIGVVRVIMSGQKPAPLPQAEIDKISKREGLDGFIPAPKWIRGQTRLTIIRGSLRGLEGIFQEERAQNRVQILLSILGADVPVELPIRNVERSLPIAS